jgi:HD-like signal output (HDOD) protein
MGLIAAEEYALCGLNHCQVGCALAKKWGLPQGMVTAMKNYYSADTSEGQDDYVLSVHLASAICKNNSVGLVMDKVPVKVAPDAWTKLGLDPAVETKILSVLNEEIDKATEFLKV